VASLARTHDRSIALAQPRIASGRTHCGRRDFQIVPKLEAVPGKCRDDLPQVTDRQADVRPSDLTKFCNLLHR
jgi:hypothetical protein